jgi:hypothetical protein
MLGRQACRAFEDFTGTIVDPPNFAFFLADSQIMDCRCIFGRRALSRTINNRNGDHRLFNTNHFERRSYNIGEGPKYP